TPLGEASPRRATGARVSGASPRASALVGAGAAFDGASTPSAPSALVVGGGASAMPALRAVALSGVRGGAPANGRAPASAPAMELAASADGTRAPAGVDLAPSLMGFAPVSRFEPALAASALGAPERAARAFGGPLELVATPLRAPRL